MFSEPAVICQNMFLDDHTVNSTRGTQVGRYRRPKAKELAFE